MIHTSIWALTTIRDLAAKVFNDETCVTADKVSDYHFGPRIDGTTSRRIHLTFDDGPHLVNTPRLLNELQRFGVLATFFVNGKNLETPEGQKLLERIASEGHQIGNHTYSHPHLTDLEAGQIRKEILNTERLIGDADRGIKIFRPPYGDHNALVDQIVQELGYTLVLWNVDTFDWHPEYQSDWVKHSVAKILTHKDSLVLSHDPITTTVDQLGSFIATIQELSGSALIQYSEAFLQASSHELIYSKKQNANRMLAEI
jgi:peptidoglycan-N-acetylglucosamine deacetylase